MDSDNPLDDPIGRMIQLIFHQGHHDQYAVVTDGVTVSVHLFQWSTNPLPLPEGYTRDYTFNHEMYERLAQGFEPLLMLGVTKR